MARQEQAGEIINRTAVEVGLNRVSDPYSSADAGFTQLTQLLNVAGQEMAELRFWQELIYPITIDTSADLAGNRYELPTDFDRLIPQTGWDLSNDVPVMGPLSPQDWAYLKGRDLASSSIYIAYRQYRNDLEFYPETVPAANLSFEYMTRNWAEDSVGVGIDFTTQTSDVVRLDPLLMQKFLKVKFLDAKNLPSDAARLDFDTVMENRFGFNNNAPVLSASMSSRGFPYLNGFRNTPYTNFGM